MIWLPVLLVAGVGVAAVTLGARGEYHRVRTPADLERFGKKMGARLAKPTNDPIAVIVANTHSFTTLDGVGRGLAGSGRTVIEIHLSALGIGADQAAGAPALVVLGLVDGATPAKTRLFTAEMPPAASSSRIVRNANTFFKDVTEPGVYTGNEELVGPIEGLEPIAELMPPDVEFSGSPGRVIPRLLLSRLGVPL